MQNKVDWIITELNVLGGAEMFVSLVVPPLMEMGWDIRVITLKKGGYFVDILGTKNIPIIQIDMEKKQMTALHDLCSLWRNGKPTIVHTHLYHAGIVGRIVAKLCKIPILIAHQHGPELNRTRIRSLIDYVTNPLVDRYICNSNAVASLLESRERIANSKISIIYNGIQTINKLKVSQKIKKRFVADTAICLGCVGRLSEEKGHFWLIESVNHLIKMGYDLHAIIIGDGDLKDVLISKSIESNIHDRVRFIGAQCNIQEWLTQFDIFVQPSLWESTSLAMCEAMAARIPVVASDVGGISEIIADPKFGLLVPPRDPQALAEAIAWLIDNPKERLEIGKAGQQHVLKNFTLEKTVRQIDQLYRELLAQDG